MRLTGLQGSERQDSDWEIQEIQQKMKLHEQVARDSWRELKSRALSQISQIRSDPRLLTKAFILLGAVVVIGGVLFYEGNSKK